MQFDQRTLLHGLFLFKLLLLLLCLLQLHCGLLLLLALCAPATALMRGCRGPQFRGAAWMLGLLVDYTRRLIESIPVLVG